jgi:hypothetical protein
MCNWAGSRCTIRPAGGNGQARVPKAPRREPSLVLAGAPGPYLRAASSGYRSMLIRDELSAMPKPVPARLTTNQIPVSLARIQSISASRDKSGISLVSVFLTAGIFAFRAGRRHRTRA